MCSTYPQDFVVNGLVNLQREKVLLFTRTGPVDVSQPVSLHGISGVNAHPAPRWEINLQHKHTRTNTHAAINDRGHLWSVWSCNIISSVRHCNKVTCGFLISNTIKIKSSLMITNALGTVLLMHNGFVLHWQYSKWRTPGGKCVQTCSLPPTCKHYSSPGSASSSPQQTGQTSCPWEWAEWPTHLNTRRGKKHIVPVNFEKKKKKGVKTLYSSLFIVYVRKVEPVTEVLWWKVLNWFR